MPKPMGKKVNRIVISDDEDDDLHEALKQLSRGPSRIDSSSDEVEQQAKSPKVRVFVFAIKLMFIFQKCNFHKCLF